VLDLVDVGMQRLDDYEPAAGTRAIDALVDLARPLRGARILHINATPYGGGVAEILRSEIPLLRSLGIAADWRLITGDDAFFTVTKKVHNGLQGDPRVLTSRERSVFLHHAERNAALLQEDYDLVVVHDPQPLAVPALRGRGSSRWIWRCHIDTSEPNSDTWAFLVPYLDVYDAAVFTLGSFAPPDLPVERVEIIPPAIDPQSPKNLALDPDLATRVLHWLGVDLTRPFVTQISRFDPWKDPLGVVAAYRRAKRDAPEVQLVLAGSMALDDPQGWDVYRQITAASHDDPDIYVFTNLTGVGNIEVNALQQHAHVVVQKSLREGFGLVVSEALWKRTPVVATRAGGIPLQMRGGGGYLVDSIDECAERLLELVRDPSRRAVLGEAGREMVRERFLLTRLVADDVRLYRSLLGDKVPPGPHGTSGIGSETRDPVCGMRLDPNDAIVRTVRGDTYLFCSHSCAREFEREPALYLRSAGVARLPDRRT
jgi:trehalose synthase